jgi:membrane protease YdiL (CAAX protease family)
MTLPTEPPRWTFALATVIWAIVVGFATRVAFAVFIAPIAGRRAIEWLSGSPSGLALSATVIQFALLGMAIVRATLVPDLRASMLRAVQSRPSRWLTSALLVLGAAPLANVCGVLVAHLTGSDLDAMQRVSALVRRATISELAILTLTLALLPAIVEEGIFRGLVLGTLDELRPAVALAVSAVAFGAFHLDLAQGVATAILGIGFGYVVQTTGSVVGSMVAHCVYNLAVLLLQRLLPATSTALKWQLAQVALGLLIAGVAALRLHRARFADHPPEIL